MLLVDFVSSDYIIGPPPPLHTRLNRHTAEIYHTARSETAAAAVAAGKPARMHCPLNLHSHVLALRLLLCHGSNWKAHCFKFRLSASSLLQVGRAAGAGLPTYQTYQIWLIRCCMSPCATSCAPKQQLGYPLHSFACLDYGVLGFSVVVLMPKYTADTVEQGEWGASWRRFIRS